MTKTLTTQDLRQIVDSHEKGYGMSVPINYGYLAARELLANREAQPVLYASEETLAYAKEGEKSLVTWSEPMGDAVIPLYTAPPAPAVEEFGTSRCCKDKKCNAPIVGYSVDGLCEDCYMEMSKRPAPVVNPEFTGATAVPDGFCIMPLTLTAANGAKGALSGEFKVSRTVRCHECGGEGCDDCADAGEFEEEITVPWDTIKDIYRAAVDTCRAAMLAQPVSQGYKSPEGFKLMPIEMTDEIGEAIAMEARCCGGIALCIYEAALAAAPEGGNEK